MKKLFKKVQDLLSIFTDVDGQFKYCVYLDGDDIIIVPSDGFDSFSSVSIARIENLKSELSEFLDCNFYISCRENKPYIRFYISKE